MAHVHTRGQWTVVTTRHAQSSPLPRAQARSRRCARGEVRAWDDVGSGVCVCACGGGGGEVVGTVGLAWLVRGSKKWNMTAPE